MRALSGYAVSYAVSKIENESQFPLIQKVLMSDFYVDVLSGHDDLEETIKLEKQLTALLTRRQFYLRKWKLNEERVLSRLTSEGKEEDLLMINKEASLKVLGIFWNQEVFLQYDVKGAKLGR